jgi:hypothetical protein
VIGLVSAGIYATAFTSTWPLWQHFGQPQADYAWFGRYSRASQALYVCVFAALFTLQYIAYRVARAQPEAAPLDIIVSGQIIFGILNVWIYPVAALDLYDYLMYGRIVLEYGGNPFLQPPSAFPDPLVAYSPWPNDTAPAPTRGAPSSWISRRSTSLWFAASASTASTSAATCRPRRSARSSTAPRRSGRTTGARSRTRSGSHVRGSSTSSSATRRRGSRQMS